jgi:prepilin-type N-terminal cleavage/methylation domain-containing protein
MLNPPAGALGARQNSRGFTLVEVMIVVAIMSVLAALAVYGVRRYILYSKTAEATNMIKDIKEGQESYRRETHRYLQVSSALDDYYPKRTGEPGTKIQWGGADASLANWKTLNVFPDAPVYFSYSSIIGPAGQELPQAFKDESTRDISWGPAPTDIWYVVKAVADLDGDESDFSVFVGSSVTSEIWSDNPGD